MNLKPWREIAVPHSDVLKGSFLQAEFAADISRVHNKTATDEYQNPELFFQRTFITEGMAALLSSVLKRLSGKGGDPVIQLQTAFGGGKTHTLLAVMHMVSGMPADRLVGMPALLKQTGVDRLPMAKVVVLDGIALSPNQPRKVEGATLNTLWGELAWQLGGATAYTRIAEADRSGTSPGKDALIELINAYSPCVILLDELVAYVRQFEGSHKHAGGTYDAILSFIQALTEAMKATPHAVLLASLPESDREAGSEHGINALHALEHYFARVQAVWKPVSSDEAFEIVRRRLFTRIEDRVAADAVCKAFIDAWHEHKDSLPGETQELRYHERLKAAYPIHPEVFERLYSDWSSLPNFQRTRGVLKLMARVIHRLWQDNNSDLMILPGSLPLYDRDVAAELVTYLPAGWDPVIERDVDGQASEPAELGGRDPRLGAVQAFRRATRTIFLGSAPGAVNQGAQGIDTTRVVLGCLQPDQQPHLYRDALGKLETRLTYLNKAQDRWWLDMRPNLRRTMEERKSRIPAAEVVDELRRALQRKMGPCMLQVHPFTPAADVPDDWGLHLVVLPHEQAWVRKGRNLAEEAAQAVLRTRGEQPRVRQNRVLFLAADAEQVGHLLDTTRALLAWRSIEQDAKDLRLTIDNRQQQQAAQWRERAQDAQLRETSEVFKHLLVPVQDPKRDGTPSDITWSEYPLNAGSQGLGKEIDRVLKDNELVIDAWAPLHLHNLLARWFWREGVAAVNAQEVWEKSCNYLYLPRLTSSNVLRDTIGAGAPSRDFFGIASAREGDAYRGFSYGREVVIYMDAALLIEPLASVAYEAAHRSAASPVAGNTSDSTGSIGGVGATTGGATAPTLGSPAATPATQPGMTHYYGTVELNPITASVDFAKIQRELIGLFTADVGAHVQIRVDIEVVRAEGFDEGTVRAARENAGVLGLKTSTFD